MAVNLQLKYLIFALLALQLVCFANIKLDGTINVTLLEDSRELPVVPLKRCPVKATLVKYSIDLPVVPRKVYYDNRTVKGKPRNLLCILAEVNDQVLKRKINIVSCELNGYSSQKVKLVEDPIKNWIKVKYSNRYKYYYAMIKCSGIPYEAITNGSTAHVLYQTKGEDKIIQVQVDHPLYLPSTSQKKTSPTKGDNSIVVCATMYSHPPRFNEWLVYQKAVGMDQVHLNVDKTFFENATSVYPFLKDALESGFVSMEVWQTNPHVFYYSQSLKYQDCVMRYQGVFDLAIMLDYDDLFIPLLPDEKDIHYYAKKSFSDNTGSLIIPWNEFSCEVDQKVLARLKDGNVTESLKSHFSLRRQERKVITKLSAVELVGMDKSIGDIMTPLCQLDGEISNIKLSIENAIAAVDGKLAERTQVRTEKDTLQRLLCILDSIEKLERLLNIKRHSTIASEDGKQEEIEQLTKKSEFAAMVMERVACEFNKLQYNVQLTDHPLVEDNKSRIAVITSTLQSKLEESFQRGLDNKDKSIVTQCLQTYASINRCRSAEMLFGKLVIFPSLDKIITIKALLSHAQGLAGLYGDMLACITEQCCVLMEVTSRGAAVVKGYDFLVNSVWPQLVSLLELKVSVIFAQGNPETFHKNYMTSIQFVTDFEELCCSSSSVKALRTHAAFNTFINKWSLPVYFQIRYQEIGGALESCLALPLIHCTQESHDFKSHPPYKLEVFNVLEECIKKCWKDDIFIQALVHRFWKLTLQLLVRVSVWLQELTALPLSKEVAKKGQLHGGSASEGLKLEDVFDVIHDSEILAKTVLDIYADLIKNKLVVYQPKESLLFKSLSEARSSILTLVPNFARLIIDGIASLCKQELESANILPRLYRRTNKEIPSRASAYVSSTLRPLQCKIKDFPSHYKLEWTDQVITELAKRYFEVGGELLTSVQRTEESLLKLKSYRKSLVPTSSLAGGGMTDDNKIRLQLALDIEEFTMQVLYLHPSAINIANFKQLLEQGQMAKTTALATHSA